MKKGEANATFVGNQGLEIIQRGGECGSATGGRKPGAATLPAGTKGRMGSRDAWGELWTSLKGGGGGMCGTVLNENLVENGL